ncbi:MAG: hypothetical protein HKN23_10825 [Verrucomicrobiales bacterium]|nr:hypothetical protein [Verrucomicrobiales bacterium]
MARVKLVLAFIALVILAAGVAGAAWYWEKIARVDMKMSQEIEGRGGEKRDVPDLGKRHFDKAIELLREGELQAAQETLYYLLEYYPESETYPEARRILGEVNLDLLISKTPLEGKTEYTVRGGDAPITIARKAKTTIDYIMRANGKMSAMIYKDEKLTVYPLEFELDIHLADRKVIVTTKDGKFFKEYEILDTNLPSTLKAPVSTTLKAKVAWHGDRYVSIREKQYMNAQKWMQSGKQGLFIRHVPQTPPAEKENAPYGVMLSKPDFEELFTIIRTGSPVRLHS